MPGHLKDIKHSDLTLYLYYTYITRDYKAILVASFVVASSLVSLTIRSGGVFALDSQLEQYAEKDMFMSDKLTLCTIKSAGL